MLFKKHQHWVDLYSRLKGPDWPQEAPLEVDFYLLPKWVREELRAFGYEPNQDFPARFSTGGINDITVFYLPGQDGGGTTFGQEYVPVIQQRYPCRRFKRCYEWCSGPGFIGFALMSHDICSTLCLTDIHDPALICAEETKHYASNQCCNNVDIYLLKDLSLLPSHEKFDLVVANPPHAQGFDVENHWFHNNNRITTDVNWEAHKNFFANIRDHLSDDGVILLQENHAGSTVDTFRNDIEHAGLEIKNTWNSPGWYDDNQDVWPVLKIYYIEIVKRIS